MACYREDERGRRTLMRATQAPFQPGWTAGKPPVASPEPSPQPTKPEPGIPAGDAS